MQQHQVKVVQRTLKFQRSHIIYINNTEITSVVLHCWLDDTKVKKLGVGLLVAMI